MRPLVLRSWRAVLGAVLVASNAFAQSVAASAPAPASDGGAAAQPSSLGDAAELARVVGLYDSGKYAECASALHELLRPNGPRPLRDPDVVQSARTYQAACLIGSGHAELADEPLRAAIHDNPQMKPPDSLVFPPAVVERFLRVREASLAEIRRDEAERVKKAQAAAALQEQRVKRERARVAALEELAQEETIVVRNRRWLALVPFGVGQFQNDADELGWVFLSSEALLGAGTLTSLGVYTSLIHDANRKQAQGKALDPGTNSQLANWHSAVQYTSYAWLALTLVGVAQAELAFVPERREIQRRALPKEVAPQTSLRLRPEIFSAKQGALFGVSGTF